MSERGPALRSVAAEWWEKPVLPEEDLPEGEPFALREGRSGETRDQRLSSLATGVHLAPGDLTHSKPVHFACRRHEDHRATGSFPRRDQNRALTASVTNQGMQVGGVMPSGGRMSNAP